MIHIAPVMNATATKIKAADRKKLNSKFCTLCKTYFPHIPTQEIKTILNEFGLDLEDGIYTGRSGESIEHVGAGVYLRLTWYKLESGNFEIVAYVS